MNVSAQNVKLFSKLGKIYNKRITNMSSVIRCGQLVNGHFTTIQRQSMQLNKCCRILNVVPTIYGRDSHDIRRTYFKFHQDWQKNQQHRPYGIGVFELVSIGCVSVAIYNWKRYALN